MLKTLQVEKFALIDRIDVDFCDGLNIITGETGAGKSILIGALGSTLGEKVDGDVLRKGSQKAIIEGMFSYGHISEIDDILLQNEIDLIPDKTVILRKEVHQSGRNRAFVNDTPVTVNVLTEIGDLLVDLHGQHDHQALLNGRYHIQYLDDYGHYADLLHEVAESHRDLMKYEHELQDLVQKEQSLREKKELYQFQLREINAINPQPGEEEELIQDEKILTHSEKLFEATNTLYEKLYGMDGSAFEIISEAHDTLTELKQIDAKFGDFITDIATSRITIDELAKFLQSYNASVEFNPARLEEIRERLVQFSRLKKKFGASIHDVLMHRDRLVKELGQIDNLDTEMERLRREVSDQRSKFSLLCERLSRQRREVASELERVVTDVLHELGMPAARFKVSIDAVEDDDGIVVLEKKCFRANHLGMDQIEFLISANTGEDLKPLVKVASGGEISRVMLSIKSALAQADRVPVLIFDEIDNGVSGRIAQAVGRRLRKLARTHQIICITHLPQIASMADHHFVVEKFTDNDQSFTRIRKLQPDEQAFEVAKLMGGEVISEAQLEGAVELIREARGLS
ncbi:DNA repair protein RecN [candidate division KSB1 bacterium]|nr:DNA repair protein RecN [candidate division KSB1 bacterium]